MKLELEPPGALARKVDGELKMTRWVHIDAEGVTALTPELKPDGEVAELAHLSEGDALKVDFLVWLAEKARTTSKADALANLERLREWIVNRPFDAPPELVWGE